MRKNLILAACTAVLACACQQQQDPKQKGDTNFQERRQKGGCCESEKVETLDKAEKVEAVQQSTTVATPEVKKAE